MDPNLLEEEEIAKILHNLRLFKTTERVDLLKLAKLGKFSTINAGDIIFKQDDNQQTGFLVIDGTIGIYRDDLLMARYESGQFFGEFSMLDGSRYSADAKAETSAVLISFSREDFLSVIQNSKTFGLSIIESLCKRLRRHL